MDSNAATAALEGRYAALRAEAGDLSSDELLDVIELAQREKDAASARQAVALAHLSARESHLREDGTWAETHRGLGHQRIDAPELAAPRLGVSVHVASNRILTAIRQLTRTPAVVDAMAAGDLDDYRASVVTEETEFLSDESAAEVVARVAEHWKGLAPGPLRRLVARTAAQVDPDAVAKEAQDERARRGLTRRTGAQGTDHWRGDFAVEQARGAWDAVTARAKQLVREGRAETLQAARADAMMELILGHCDVKVVVHATHAAVHDDFGPGHAEANHDDLNRGAASPVDTSHDETSHDETSHDETSHDETSHDETSHDHPARSGAAPGGRDLVEVGGMGASGTTFVPREWLQRAMQQGMTQAMAGAAQGSGAHSRERRLTCEPRTGALLAGDVPEGLATGGVRSSRAGPRAEDPSESYRIPAAMARLVRLRDSCCRFPGCSTAARLCDLDHVRPWPAGPTDPRNLMALCRRHHRIKQRADWRVEIHADATVTWTDPTGLRVTTRPVDHLHLVTTSTTNTHAATRTRDAAPPSMVEDELHDLLDRHGVPPRRPHVKAWDARGHALCDARPRIDVHTGRVRDHRTGRHVTVAAQLPTRPPPPPEAPGRFPF